MAQTQNTLARILWLANLSKPEESTEFVAANGQYLPGDLEPWSARNFLREIWHGGEQADRIITMLLTNQTTLATTVDGMAKGPDRPSLALNLLCVPRVDWKRGELVFEKWPSEFHSDLYRLLRQSENAKVCAYPECKEPYFLAKRGNQRYCGAGACIDAMQGKWRSDWWKTHGKQWRKNRKKLKRGKRV